MQHWWLAWLWWLRTIFNFLERVKFIWVSSSSCIPSLSPVTWGISWVSRGAAEGGWLLKSKSKWINDNNPGSRKDSCWGGNTAPRLCSQNNKHECCDILWKDGPDIVTVFKRKIMCIIMFNLVFIFQATVEWTSLEEFLSTVARFLTWWDRGLWRWLTKEWGLVISAEPSESLMAVSPKFYPGKMLSKWKERVE